MNQRRNKPVRRGGPKYARTDRVKELIREVVATEIERLGDERLFSVAITGADVDNELTKAVVYFDVLDEEDLPTAQLALDENRYRFQKAFGEGTRMRRTPRFEFQLDASIGGASRIEKILGDIKASEQESN